MEEQQKKLLQWHAAFFAGIQIELEEEAEIQSEEVSISYVCSKYPRELIKYLLGKGRVVEKKEQGIYFIYGEPFAIQIVINPLLSEETNLWLKNLSNKINSVETAERLIREYERKKESKW